MRALLCMQCLQCWMRASRHVEHSGLSRWEACAGKAAEDVVQQAAVEAGPPAPQGLSLRERIAAAAQPEEEAGLGEEPEHPPQQAQQHGRVPVQEPLGWAASPFDAPSLPGTLSPDPASAAPAAAVSHTHHTTREAQAELVNDGTGQPQPAQPDNSQVALVRAADGPVAIQPQPLDLPHPPRTFPAEDTQHAATAADEGALQLPAPRQCPWPWLQDLQQAVKDWGAGVSEPAAQRAVPPAPAAAAPSAEQRACVEAGRGRPLSSHVRAHGEEAVGGRQPAAAETVGRRDRLPAAAKDVRQSPCRAGRKRSFLEAAPCSMPPQKVSRKLADQSPLNHAPVSAAPPSLSLAERMRLAEDHEMVQEHPASPPMHPAPQPQPLREGVRQLGATALASTKQTTARISPSSTMPTQPLHPLLQVWQQSGPQEASVQPRQAPPKFSEDTHNVPTSRQHPMQRLRKKSRSPLAHPETESCVRPPQQEAPASRSGDGVDVVDSQEALAQRLRRESRSTDGNAGPGAAGQPLSNRPGHALEATIQESRHQVSGHIAKQQAFTDSAPGECNDWAGHQDQHVQTPQVCTSAEAAAVVPDSARSGSGEDATPELQWRRPKPCSHALQDSSGRPPPSLGHSKRPQQPNWDDSQTDQAVQCMAPELGTPLMTHASSAGAAAPGDASTGLQWRRPLARRAQNCLDACTPGTPPYSFCVLSHLVIMCGRCAAVMLLISTAASSIRLLSQLRCSRWVS